MAVVCRQLLEASSFPSSSSVQDEIIFLPRWETSHIRHRKREPPAAEAAAAASLLR